MASRGFSKALRSQAARQLAAPAQRRTFVAVAGAAARTAATKQVRPALAGYQQVRGVKTIDFAGVPEQVYGTF